MPYTNEGVPYSGKSLATIATSQEAAEQIDASEWRARVLRAVHDSGSAGLTCDEAEKLLRGSHQTVSARFVELRDSGHVYESGRTRPTRSGRRAVVYLEGLNPEKEQQVKLFNLSKTRTEGVCAAVRCTTSGDDAPGGAWGEDTVKLCGRHLTMLIQFLEINPNYEPPIEAPELPAGAMTNAVVNDQAMTVVLEPFVVEGKTFKDEYPVGYLIKTHDELVAIAELLAYAKTQRTELEKMEKGITGPINTGLQKARSLFRPSKMIWADVELRLKSIVSARKLIEDQANKTALADAAAAHQRGDARGTASAIARVTTVGDVSGISTTSKWKYIIEDETLLPREFLMPNEKLIKEHCAHSTDRAPTPIAGVKFYPDVGVSVTASKVLGTSS